ncbi:MAG: phosphatase PAP2 family protein [Nocardioidaceae bacterium]|nr:phosphatase PAP2 family protein [Nocardioidaceae bacterium]
MRTRSCTSQDTLHLPSELGLQDWLLNTHWLVESANMYYAWVHFPATALFLAWTYLRRADFYPAIRNEMMLITAGATIGHIVFPLAPPRMLQPVGFVDTAALYGPGVYGAPDVHSFANQYAAMPSLHVAWALVVGGVLAMLTRSRWRWMWLAHPALTIIVVVGTANHYWMDAIVAMALFVLALPAALFVERHRRPGRQAQQAATTRSRFLVRTAPRWPLQPAGIPSQRNGPPAHGAGIARSLLSGPVDTGPPRTALLRSSRIEPPEPALRRLAHPPRRGGQAWWSRQMGRLH